MTQISTYVYPRNMTPVSVGYPTKPDTGQCSLTHKTFRHVCGNSILFNKPVYFDLGKDIIEILQCIGCCYTAKSVTRNLLKLLELFKVIINCLKVVFLFYSFLVLTSCTAQCTFSNVKFSYIQIQLLVVLYGKEVEYLTSFQLIGYIPVAVVGMYKLQNLLYLNNLNHLIFFAKNVFFKNYIFGIIRGLSTLDGIYSDS